MLIHISRFSLSLSFLCFVDSSDICRGSDSNGWLGEDQNCWDGTCGCYCGQCSWHIWWKLGIQRCCGLAYPAAGCFNSLTCLGSRFEFKRFALRRNFCLASYAFLVVLCLVFYFIFSFFLVSREGNESSLRVGSKCKEFGAMIELF